MSATPVIAAVITVAFQPLWWFLDKPPADPPWVGVLIDYTVATIGVWYGRREVSHGN